MSTSELLVSWNEKWALNKGMVVCKACRAVQAEADGAANFAHTPECPSAHKELKPWNDLRAAIGRRSEDSQHPIRTSEI